MLTRPEYHHLKSMSGWLDQAESAFKAAWETFPDLAHKHAEEGHECGAMDVAHTFTTISVSGIIHLNWLVQALIEADDTVGKEQREFTPEEAEQFKRMWHDLVSQWTSVQLALNGLNSAYTHMGFEPELEAPPVNFERGEERPVLALFDPDAHKGPNLTVVSH